MRATWVPAVLTPATPEHVSRAYRTVLTNLIGAPSDEAVAVLHAQGALETGHFRSCWNHNAGNIKAGETYDGSFTCILLNEVLSGKTVWFSPEGELDGRNGPVKGKRWPVPDGHPQTRMRAYESLHSGIADKIRFLASGRWREALSYAEQGDPWAYVEAIRERGYFTAPLEPYARAVVQLTQKYLPVAIATAAALPAPALPEDSDELCRDMAECFRFDLPPELRARLEAMHAEHAHETMDRLRADRDRELREWADETEPTSPETPEAKQ